MTAKSRREQGLHADLCRQCATGWVPGSLKLFDMRCEGCHAKKAAGLRTGDEPPPTRRAGEKWVDHGVLRAKRAAASRARKATLTPRVPTC